MSTTGISPLSYNYYHNETKNMTFNNEQPKKTFSYENISSMEGDPLNHGTIHHHSKNVTNGTITFPLKAKILKNNKKYDINSNNLTKGSLLFCFSEENEMNHNNIGTKKEDDVCTIVDLETLNHLLALHYGKKENEEKDNKKGNPYWKQWNFVGYLRNELHQTVKAKGYRLLNVDVSGVTQTKNYWNHGNNNNYNETIQRGNELFLVLKKQWIHKVGKNVYQWIPQITSYSSNNQEKQSVIYVGSVLENKHINYHNHKDNEEFISIFF